MIRDVVEPTELVLISSEFFAATELGVRSILDLKSFLDYRPHLKTHVMSF